MKPCLNDRCIHNNLGYIKSWNNCCDREDVTTCRKYLPEIPVCEYTKYKMMFDGFWSYIADCNKKARTKLYLDKYCPYCGKLIKEIS